MCDLQVRFLGDIQLFGVQGGRDGQKLRQLLCGDLQISPPDHLLQDVIRKDAENDSILDLSFQELDGMEYLDVKNYLEMQAKKLRNYLPGYSAESSSFRAPESAGPGRPPRN